MCLSIALKYRDLCPMSTMASFYRNLCCSQHSICSGMEQKKTALSAQLRNMDTWQQQWEEGCPRRLNTTPHLSLEVRAFLHFFPFSVETLPQNPEQRQESDRLISFSPFCVALLTALNVKIRYSRKMRF